MLQALGTQDQAVANTSHTPARLPLPDQAVAHPSIRCCSADFSQCVISSATRKVAPWHASTCVSLSPLHPTLPPHPHIPSSYPTYSPIHPIHTHTQTLPSHPTPYSSHPSTLPASHPTRQPPDNPPPPTLTPHIHPLQIRCYRCSSPTHPPLPSQLHAPGGTSSFGTVPRFGIHSQAASHHTQIAFPSLHTPTLLFHPTILCESLTLCLTHLFTFKALLVSYCITIVLPYYYCISLVSYAVWPTHSGALHPAGPLTNAMLHAEPERASDALLI